MHRCIRPEIRKRTPAVRYLLENRSHEGINRAKILRIICLEKRIPAAATVDENLGRVQKLEEHALQKMRTCHQADSQEDARLQKVTRHLHDVEILN